MIKNIQKVALADKCRLVETLYLKGKIALSFLSILTR